MGWTTPQNWTAVPFTVSNLNTQIRDNLIFLKDPTFARALLDEGSNYTTTSASFTNIDAGDTEGKFKHTATTYGGDIFVGFNGMIAVNTDATSVLFNISIDGTPYFADDGFIGLHRSASSIGNARIPLSFLIPIPKADVPAGSHIFRLMWKTTGGATGTLYAGAGTAGADIHPGFWVREIS
jgi:hypothetical protein